MEYLKRKYSLFTIDLTVGRNAYMYLSTCIPPEFTPDYMPASRAITTDELAYLIAENGPSSDDDDEDEGKESDGEGPSELRVNGIHLNGVYIDGIQDGDDADEESHESRVNGINGVHTEDRNI